jgi:hypothetical protein
MQGRPGIDASRHAGRADGHVEPQEKRLASVAAPALLPDGG